MRSVSPKCLVRPVNLLHLYQEPYIVNQMSRSRDCDLFKEYRRKAFDDFCNLLRETRSFEDGSPDVTFRIDLTPVIDHDAKRV
jgi:hypothetical protein